jgi:hypothetical protein
MSTFCTQCRRKRRGTDRYCGRCQTEFLTSTEESSGTEEATDKKSQKKKKSRSTITNKRGDDDTGFEDITPKDVTQIGWWSKTKQEADREQRRREDEQREKEKEKGKRRPVIDAALRDMEDDEYVISSRLISLPSLIITNSQNLVLASSREKRRGSRVCLPHDSRARL